MKRPNKQGDLCNLIGLIELSSQSFPLYNQYIRLCMYILSKYPEIGSIYQKKDMELIQNLWNPDDQRLLERLKKKLY